MIKWKEYGITTGRADPPYFIASLLSRLASTISASRPHYLQLNSKIRTEFELLLLLGVLARHDGSCLLHQDGMRHGEVVLQEAEGLEDLLVASSVVFGYTGVPCEYYWLYMFLLLRLSRPDSTSTFISGRISSESSYT